jgi:hypothetical protein
VGEKREGSAREPQLSLGFRHRTSRHSGGEGLDIGKNASARLSVACQRREVLVWMQQQRASRKGKGK